VQVVDITGVYGLSFLLVAGNWVLYNWYAALTNRRRSPLKTTAITVLCVAAVYGYGAFKIQTIADSDRRLQVGIVQGNIDQELKWDETFQKETIGIYKQLSSSLESEHPDLLVWPEAAVPGYFPSGTDLDRDVFAVADRLNSMLLLGSLTAGTQGDKLLVYNSAQLIGPGGRLLERYNKIHLVPFGEYVPLSRYVPFLSTLTPVGNTTAGTRYTIFDSPQGRFGVLICFEVIFADLCRQFVRDGAEFMVTITNDAWFGDTSAPFQHLAQAAFRSIENRVWLVRGANTGVSAVVDPTGRIRKQTGLFTRETLSASISPGWDYMTVYTRHGDVWAWICVVIAGVLSLYALARRA
jgi:apolipoprotein N-acyltransferase